MFCELLKQDGRVVGAVGLHSTSSHLYVVQAKVVVIATGTSALKSGSYPTMYWTGDGSAMAYRAGAEVAGEEIGFGAGHKPLNMEELKTGSGGGRRGSPRPIRAAAAFPHALGGGYTGSWFCPNINAEGSPMTNTIWEAHCGRAPLYLDMSLAFKTWTPEQHDWLEGVLQADGNRPAGQARHRRLQGREDPLAGLQDHGVHRIPGQRGLAGGQGPARARFRDCTPPATAAPRWSRAPRTPAWASRSTMRRSRAPGRLSRPRSTSPPAGSRRPEEAELRRAKDAVLAPTQREGGFSPAWVTQVLQGFTVPYFVLQVKTGGSPAGGPHHGGVRQRAPGAEAHGQGRP